MNRTAVKRISRLSVTIGGVALMAAASAGAKTTISYSTWGNTEEVAVDKALIAAFEKSNPTIEVSLNVPAGDYEEKLAVMVAGGTPPDVITLGRSAYPDFATAVQPIPLTGVDKDDYIASSMLSSLTYKGEQLGLPKRMNTKVMFYDKGAFNRAGMAVPTGSWTPADYGDASKKLTVRTDTAVQRWGSGPAVIWNWFAAFGASLFNPEMTKAQFASPEMIAATKFLAAQHKKYAGWFDDFSDFNQALYTGKMAMFADIGPWYVPGFVAAKNLDWRFTETPGKPLEVEMVGLSISKDTKHFKESVAFAKFVSSSPQAQAIIANGTNLPVTKAGVKLFVNRVPDKGLGAFTDVLQKYTFPVLAKKPVNVSDLYGTIWDTFYQKILSGTIDPMSGLESLQHTIQSRLDAKRK